MGTHTLWMFGLYAADWEEMLPQKASLLVEVVEAHVAREPRV